MYSFIYRIYVLTVSVRVVYSQEACAKKVYLCVRRPYPGPYYLCDCELRSPACRIRFKPYAEHSTRQRRHGMGGSCVLLRLNTLAQKFSNSYA